MRDNEVEFERAMGLFETVKDFIFESDMIIRDELNKMLLHAGLDVQGKTIEQIEQLLDEKGIRLSTTHNRSSGNDIVSYHLQKEDIRHSVQFQYLYEDGSLKLIKIARGGYE